MNVNEMSATQVIENLNMLFDWKRRPYEGKFLQRALDLLKEQEEQIKNRDESLEKAREEIKWLREMLKEQEPVKVNDLCGLKRPPQSWQYGVI